MNTHAATKTSSVMNVPNFLSIVRILLIVPILWLLQRNDTGLALGLVVFAFLTDYWDGQIARKKGLTTALGSILDPIADKLIVISLMLYFGASGLLDVWYVWLVVLRDILQLMAIPILMVWKKVSFKVDPKMFAKVATSLKFLVITMVFVILMGGGEHMEYLKNNILFPLVLISAAMEVYIFVTYTKRFKAIYQGEHDTFE